MIPTAGFDRNGYLMQLLNQIDQQTIKQYEFIVIWEDFQQDRTINVGANVAHGKYLLMLGADRPWIVPI